MDQVTIKDGKLECPRCGLWGDTTLTEHQAVVLAAQLLVAATHLPIDRLWPTAVGHDG